MNKETLLKLLNEKLLDKVINTPQYDVMNVIRDELKAEGYPQEVIYDIWVERNTSGNYLYLAYKQIRIAIIKTAKKKGSYRCYGHYNWLYNKFEIVDDFDLDTKIQNCLTTIANRNKEKEEKQKRMFDIYKKLAAEYGDETYHIIDYLKDNYYTLRDMFEKEGGK